MHMCNHDIVFRKMLIIKQTFKLPATTCFSSKRTINGIDNWLRKSRHW